MKLMRHDIIEIKKGLKIIGKIPSCYVYYNKPFSMEKAEHEFPIGKVYDAPVKTADFEKINETLKQDLVLGLERIGLISENHLENIQNYITGLNLKLETKEFDTSIFAGKYKVFFVENDKEETWIHCEKLDDSKIEIRFRSSAISHEDIGEIITKLN